MANRKNLVSPVPPVTDGDYAVFDGTSGYVIKDGGNATSAGNTSAQIYARISVRS